MSTNQMTGAILDASIQVHRELGPGLLESTYEICLARELRKRGHHVVTQMALPVLCDGEVLEAGYKIDLLVADQVIVELKSVDSVLPIHKAQLLTYLKLSKRRIGLLINFNVPMLKDGFKRFVND